MDAIIRPSAVIHNHYSELELLCTLAEAEEDVKTGRVAPIQESFDDIRSKLQEMRNEI